MKTLNEIRKTFRESNKTKANEDEMIISIVDTLKQVDIKTFIRIYDWAYEGFGKTNEKNYKIVESISRKYIVWENEKGISVDLGLLETVAMRMFDKEYEEVKKIIWRNIFKGRLTKMIDVEKCVHTTGWNHQYGFEKRKVFVK